MKWLRRRCIFKKIHYLTFNVDPNPKLKVKQYITKFPLHYVIYAPSKFAVALFNGLGGDAFTRNLMDGRMDGRTTGRLW